MIPFTCKDIDSLLFDIKYIQREFESFNELDKEDQDYVLREVLHTLSFFPDKLEELRESNKQLREYGEKLADELANFKR